MKNEIIIINGIRTYEREELVCDEILPSIRKDGRYIVSNSDDTDEDIMTRAWIIRIAKRNMVKY